LWFGSRNDAVCSSMPAVPGAAHAERSASMPASKLPVMPGTEIMLV
jgi:hypothetical protein